MDTFNYESENYVITNIKIPLFTGCVKEVQIIEDKLTQEIFCDQWYNFDKDYVDV